MSDTNIYTGWTAPVSDVERTLNETAACIELVEMYPQNGYYQERLAAALVTEYEARQAEREELDADFGELRDLAYMVPPEPTWECPYNLNDCTPEEQARWYNSLPEIEI